MVSNGDMEGIAVNIGVVLRVDKGAEEGASHWHHTQPTDV